MQTKDEQNEKLLTEAAKHLVQNVLRSVEESDEDKETPHLRRPSNSDKSSDTHDHNIKDHSSNEKIDTEENESVVEAQPVEKNRDSITVKFAEGLSVTNANAVKIVSSSTSTTTTTTSTSEEISSVEEVPRLCETRIGFIHPLGPIPISPVVQFPTEMTKVRFPVELEHGCVHEDRFYAPIRSSGVGANSPGSPHACLTLIEPIDLSGDTMWQSTTTDLAMASSQPETKTAATIIESSGPVTATSWYSSERNGHVPISDSPNPTGLIPSNSGENVIETENSKAPKPVKLTKDTVTNNLIDEKLGPFTQALPTYTPSRVYLRTINQNLTLNSAGFSNTGSPYSQRYVPNFYTSETEKPGIRDDVPRLVLSDSPPETHRRVRSIEEVLSPCPLCPRFVRRSVKNLTPVRNSSPLRKRLSLSWWQPLNSTDPPRFTLPEPSVKVVRRLVQEQTARELRMANAIAQAHREAELQKAAKYERIRNRARRHSSRQSRTQLTTHTKEFTRPRIKVNPDSMHTHSIRVSGVQKLAPRNEFEQITQTDSAQTRRKYSNHSGASSTRETESETIDDFSDRKPISIRLDQQTLTLPDMPITSPSQTVTPIPLDYSRVNDSSAGGLTETGAGVCEIPEVELETPKAEAA
ncbi:unnamed protein product, partial [Echinostoma caproni]|uniref:Uncharacterized protein n=1 Tax=Echinostoma caproni TaxID=27848 RepID=A0A183B1U9_9TREM